MSSAELLATAETERDLVVELVRMCVAEAGYDPQLIQPYEGPASGYTFQIIDDLVPPPVCWRARELVGIGEPKCFECTLLDRRAVIVRPCRATERFELDCRAPWTGDPDRVAERD